MKKQLPTKEKKDLEKKPASDMQRLQPISPFWPFVSFRYSSRSVFFDGEKTHIKARETRFNNGRLDSEEFEGTLDKGVYHAMVGEMQRAFLKQMELFFKPLSLFLSGPDDKKD